ncbi:hypothetical protein PanWU01x14_052790 [Parasponia andersonii]|uniref:Uncharacterized protein n=1 Tax=Parasponia andersonii TaxID=3476 RepID=A0A2P5DL91_PARAD|nr:hypothetical protein PanWU01x14_052790 [Parasponia andersonii]
MEYTTPAFQEERDDLVRIVENVPVLVRIIICKSQIFELVDQDFHGCWSGFSPAVHVSRTTDAGFSNCPHVLAVSKFSEPQARSERQRWLPAKTLRCLTWFSLSGKNEYLSPQDLFQPSRAEISVISSVLPWPDFCRLLRLQSVRSKIWTNRRSVRTACPWNTHLPRTTLNALSGFGAVGCFPLYPVRRPLRLLTLPTVEIRGRCSQIADPCGS